MRRNGIARHRAAIIVAAVLFLVGGSLVAISLADKIRECSDLGGSLEVSPRATWVVCRLSDGRAVPL